MKQFIYQAQDAGFQAWPSGELRLDGIEETRNPAEADIFVCPGNLSLFQVNGLIQQDVIYRLPFFKGNESRHVFFDVSDNFKMSIGLPCIFIRCDVRTWMLSQDTGTIQIAWPVEDYSECIELPEGGFKYDVSCWAWMSTETRWQSSNACKSSDLKCDIQQFDDFTGYLHDRETGQWTPEGLRRRKEFRRSMKESRIMLCPESIPGVLPYRFFEAMSAGRVPLLVSSDYVLPFADKIPYADFMITCESARAIEAAAVIHDFLRTHSDRDLMARGLMARWYWEMWLNSAKWPTLLAYAVAEKMGQPCALP